ncbi:MAG: RNA polymerase sigma factor [Planctomycetaceae bacterium]|nr:RNA polymerase sigma factor [Planctomycetaceae bacterium]
MTNQDPGSTPIRFADQNDVVKSQQGDPDAYRRLIEKYQGHVGKLLWRFTRDRSNHEELVQETFVQAYYSLHTYKAQAPFENWLACIATRVGYRFWKDTQRHRHSDILENDWEQMAKPEPQGMTAEQAGELLHKLLEQLPPRDRLVLTLRFVEQCDIVETARRTGWSQALVKVQTHRAKQKLKQLVEKADMELDTL